MRVIKGVETLGGSTSYTINIGETINPENSILIINYGANNNSSRTNQYTGEIISGTQLRFRRGAPFSATSTLYWTIIESPQISVERGFFLFSGETTHTINATKDLSNSFVIYSSNELAPNNNTNIHSSFCSTELIYSENNVVFRRTSSARDSEVAYQIITWQGVETQHLFFNANLSSSISLSQVDASKSVLIVNSATNSQDAQNDRPCFTLTNENIIVDSGATRSSSIGFFVLTSNKFTTIRGNHQTSTGVETAVLGTGLIHESFIHTTGVRRDIDTAVGDGSLVNSQRIVGGDAITQKYTTTFERWTVFYEIVSIIEEEATPPIKTLQNGDWVPVTPKIYNGESFVNIQDIRGL